LLDLAWCGLQLTFTFLETIHLKYIKVILESISLFLANLQFIVVGANSSLVRNWEEVAFGSQAQLSCSSVYLLEIIEEALLLATTTYGQSSDTSIK